VQTELLDFIRGLVLAHLVNRHDHSGYELGHQNIEDVGQPLSTTKMNSHKRHN
jgi:hypothetical protein